MKDKTNHPKGFRLHPREAAAIALLLLGLLLAVLLLPILTGQITRQQLDARPQVSVTPVSDMEYFHNEEQ